MKIYYWSPFISHVATVKAVINSASSLNYYSNDYSAYIINVAGEWNIYKEELLKKKIKIINLTTSNVINNRNINGFLKSRLIYLYLFIISFLPLIRLLKSTPPEFFIVHLISPLPLIINFFFKINTKMVLRISGFPRLNFFRKNFWKMSLKKIHFLTCPTIATKKDIEVLNIVDKKKIHVLYDPIINIKEIKKNLTNDNNLVLKDYYLAVGRLTRQKNFLFLLSVFKKFNKDKKNILVIVGSGEQKKMILDYIRKNSLDDVVFVYNFTDKIFKFYKNSKCFILPSLWEDPGFVLIEACYMNVPIISSNCKNGPEEIMDFGRNGILFKSNDEKSLFEAFQKFEQMSQNEIKKSKYKAKIKCKEFTVFNHFKKMDELLKAYD